MINLTASGLNETEAKTYTTLLSKSAWKPSELAKAVGETRTNMYKILDKLVDAGLAEKFDKAKVFHYRANNPARLTELARIRKESQFQAEKDLALSVENLMHDYIKVHEQPGVEYFHGLDQITRIFEQLARSQTDIHFVHTRAGDDFYSPRNMHNLRMLAVNNKVWRHALTPDTDIATSDYETFDPTVYLQRTWLRQRDYEAPVEWGSFEDKLYIIAYGSEAMGVVIQSKPIADAFVQLFKIMENGQRAQQWYRSLPQHAMLPGVNKPKL